MPYQVVLLGVAGLIPFLFLPLAVVLNLLPLHESARYFTQYSAVLLSFFGGIYWWDALNKKAYGPQLLIAMLPTITAGYVLYLQATCLRWVCCRWLIWQYYFMTSRYSH